MVSVFFLCVCVCVCKDCSSTTIVTEESELPEAQLFQIAYNKTASTDARWSTKEVHECVMQLSYFLIKCVSSGLSFVRQPQNIL